MNKRRKFGMIILMTFVVISSMSITATIAPINLTCTGYVKDANTSNPVVGAYVKLYVYNFMSGWKYVGSDYTDSNGYYSIAGAGIGAKEVHISKSGYNSYEGAYQSTIYLEQITYTYTIYGYVSHLGTSTKISGATVKMVSSGVTKTDVTSSSGYYSISFTFSSSGSRGITVTITATGYVTYSQYISANPGSTRKDFAMKGIWALIAGGNEERSTRDAMNLYNTLIDHYSYTHSRIYLLTRHTTIDGASVPRDAKTTESNFDWATDQIASRCGPYDQVLVWWSSHGSVDKLYYTSIAKITASSFDNYLDDISCGQMIVYIGACYSGSLIDNLWNEQNRVVYTSSSASQLSYATALHGHFSFAVSVGLNPGIYPEERAEEADTNNDGKVSLSELFVFVVDYVDSHTTEQQDPQKWVGSQIPEPQTFIGDKFY